LLTLTRIGATSAIVVPSAVLYASYNTPKDKHGGPIKISEVTGSLNIATVVDF